MKSIKEASLCNKIRKPTNNIPWNNYSPERVRTNVWILNIGRKEPTAFQKVLEAISIQELAGKYNRVNII